MKISITFIFLIFVSLVGYAQDIMYTTDGKKEEVKIQEIKGNEIRYKKLSNPDGPDYTISRSQVLLITYENGSHESFNIQSKSKAPDPISEEYGKNFIAYNTFDLLFTNLTFSYERIVADGLIGLRVPFTVGFAGNQAYLYDNSKASINSGTIMSTGFDVNIYPQKQGKIRYFIAPSFLVTTFSYYQDYNYLIYNPYPGPQYEIKEGIQYAFVVKHGVLFQITSNFNMSCVLGLGVKQNDTDLKDETGTKASFEFNVGYKF